MSFENPLMLATRREAPVTHATIQATKQEIQESRVRVFADWKKKQSALHIKNKEVEEMWADRDWYEKYYNGMTTEEVILMNDMMSDSEPVAKACPDPDFRRDASQRKPMG